MQHSLITNVFDSWKWSDVVRRRLDEHFGDECLHEECDGDRQKAYDWFIHFLTHHETDKRGLARTLRFRDTNDGFLTSLGERRISDVVIKPAEADLKCWEILAKLSLVAGKHSNDNTASVPNNLLGQSDDKFDIWKLIRRFALLQQWPDNQDNVERLLLMDPSFEAVYTVERRDPRKSESYTSEVLSPVKEPKQLYIRRRLTKSQNVCELSIGLS